jgi:peroxiredoxin
MDDSSAVASLADLERSDYPIGEPAPTLEIAALDRGTIDLADYRGSVVVLDFWATWCLPCWTALSGTEELAAWASRSDVPVRVYAVSTLEHVEDEQEHRERVVEFLTAKGLDLPVLLDTRDDAFAAFHAPGLPSLVIIDAEGRLARYHSGLVPNMVSTIREEVEALLPRGD